MTIPSTVQSAVLRIGEVTGVDGRRIFVQVDKNKNLSHMFLDGDIVANIGVNSHVAIAKGFLTIIGRVEGEKIQDDYDTADGEPERRPTNRTRRILTLSVAGHIDERNRFSGGTKELPLVGSEAFLLTSEQLRLVHDLVRTAGPSVTIATLHGEDIAVPLPIDGLFNSHIAIFGNTGSGKSNTLASLYQSLFSALRARNRLQYETNTRFVVFDFNGEYIGPSCLTADKACYNLSTRHAHPEHTLPIRVTDLLDVEVLAILADATEKTQKPFLSRAIRLFSNIRSKADPPAYYRAVLKALARRTLQMTDKLRVFLLLDYFRQLLPEHNPDGQEVEIDSDLTWHNGQGQFMLTPGPHYLHDHPERIDDTVLLGHIDNAQFGGAVLQDLANLLYVQLIQDILANRAQNEHIAPVIHRLGRKRADIEKLFEITDTKGFWTSNVVVVNLDHVNLEMRKTIPLLLSKMLYAEQRLAPTTRTLTLIIDEAHNILSTESFREAESWKDYRLETFEEIIKEGRKFGVFVTIASQRPNDISPTITSQAHNYFIHRLINERDLQTIGSAVSYIDKSTEESIPTLPTGTCIFSGVVSAVPLKVNVYPLAAAQRPRSATRSLVSAVPLE